MSTISDESTNKLAALEERLRDLSVGVYGEGTSELLSDSAFTLREVLKAIRAKEAQPVGGAVDARIEQAVFAVESAKDEIFGSDRPTDDEDADYWDGLEFAIAALRAQQPVQPDAGAAVPCLDLDALAWKSIKKAAEESDWIPKEHYTANDWTHDVCEFLRHGDEGAAVPEKWIDTVRDAAFDEGGYTINPDLAEVHAEMLAAAPKLTPKPEDV